MITNKLKLRMTNIFRCSPRKKSLISDVTEHPFFYPHSFHLFSPKKPPPSQPFSSICRPKTTQTAPVKPRHRKSRKRRNNSELKNKKFDELLDSVSGNYTNCWFSEDENEGKDDDRTTLFSGFKDSYAVVKRSSDPYNEFRTSMVEMIVERKLFKARELEHLLHCFLALNSSSHHMLIMIHGLYDD
ncbi:hypothetical protein ACET3Z_017667 [Daucus carota]